MMRNRIFRGAAAALAIAMSAGCGVPLAPQVVPHAPSDAAAMAALAEAWRQVDKHLIARTPEGAHVRRLPEMPREKLATVLSYRAMDNDLAADLPRHMADLEAAGSTPMLNLVVFADADGPDDSRLHYMLPAASQPADRKPASPALSSPWLHAEGPLGLNGKELDSASALTLERFVGWGFRDYPARFKVLDVSSHGAGYQGMCIDFSAGYAQMPLPAFGDAVRQGLKGRELDVLNLLACLMATVEVAYEFRGAAQMMVASEDLLMGGRVLLYERTFSQLGARKDLQKADAREVARQLVLDARPELPSSGAYTLSAIDLTRMAEVKRQLNVLSNLLIARLAANRKEILAAYDGVPVLRKDRGQSSHRDLIRFCRNLKERVTDREIVEAANRLEAACEQAIVLSRQKKLERGAAYGLSIYLPDPHEEFDAAYRNTRLARESAWDEFLLAVKKSR